MPAQQPAHRPRRWPAKLLYGLRAFPGLDVSGKTQIVESLALPLLIWAGFRLWGVSETQALLRKGARRWRIAPLPGEETTAVIEGARRAQRRVGYVSGVGGTCLVRSFTLWAMLLRRGIETDLRVGMRRTDGKVEGHAWLEYEGKLLNDDPALVATYSVLPGTATFDLWR